MKTKRILIFVLLCLMICMQVPFSAFAEEKDEPITVGNVTVTAPVVGQTPNFTAVSDDPSRYSVKIRRWIDVETKRDIYETDLKNLNSPYYNYKFEAGKQYEVVVEFEAVGDYTLSTSNSFTINGEKNYWTVNGLNRTHIFTAKTPSPTAVVSGNTFTITGSYIDGCTVILALYKEDSKGNSQLVDCQTAVYDGEAKTFPTSADYTSAKVMVWKNFKDLEPVTEVENVNLK